MTKYNLRDKKGIIIEGITIDESAKQGIKDLMVWSEDEMV